MLRPQPWLQESRFPGSAAAARSSWQPIASSTALPALETLHIAAFAAGIDYQLRVIDITLEQDESGGKAACWVDLNIKIAPFYIKRYHAPTIVMLRWRRCEDGL